MLTQCPNCQTTFRVTSDILRVADGQVRCGRCQTQFDALERLMEEPDAIEPEMSPAPAQEQEASITEEIIVPSAARHEDIVMEDLEGSTDEEASQEAEAAREYLSEEDAIAAEDRADYERAMSALAEESDESPAALPAREVPTRITRKPLGTTAHERDIDEPAAEIDFLAKPQRKREAAVWKVLPLPLALLLIAQWVHANRADLARHPSFGRPVMSAYRTLGVPLTPSWDLHAYQIRQWGLVSDPGRPGTLLVRASVTNLAEFPQPYPLLKLILEDRWGEQVGAREFEPKEYLDSASTAQRLMEPGQQANAHLSIVDPGSEAEGFRFDVCLRGRAATVCAQEVRRRR